MRTLFNNLSLSKKQVLVLLLCGLVPMLVVTYISLSIAGDSLKERSFAKLDAVREIKSSAIERYFTRIEKQILTMAQTPTITDAMVEFSGEFNRYVKAEKLSQTRISEMRAELKEYYLNDFGTTYAKANEGRSPNYSHIFDNLDDEAIVFQHTYISSNEHPLGSKDLLDRPEGGVVYHDAHQAYHPSIRYFLKEFGYYDIFLVDTNTGDIVYSVFKELDFGTSLIDGPYADTNFAQAFRDANRLDQGEFTIQDFKSYPPSYEAPASFLATPVFSEGERTGVLIFQIPLETINSIMGERAGMGDTGESYLVGPDFLMRSDSYLDDEYRTVLASFRNPEEGSIKTTATESVFSGQSGRDIITSYNDFQVLSSYGPLKIESITWAIVVELDQDELLATIGKIRNIVLILLLVFTLAIALFAIYVSRLMSAPILALGTAIQDIYRSGDFSIRVDNQNKDEVGKTCQALNCMLDDLSDAISSTNGVLDALGKGDHSQQVSTHYPGQLCILAEGVNTAVEKVKQSNEDAQEQNRRAQESANQAAEAAEDAKKQSEETLIIKQALDVSATSVMIADENFSIVYQNTAMKDLFQDTEAYIQKDIPKFSAALIMGSNIDQFHKNPSHQRQLLANLRDTYKTQVVIGGRTFALSATPIRNNEGKFLGAVIEWIDRTEELTKLEREQKVFQENARIRKALDTSATAAMISDVDNNIIYANDIFYQIIESAGTCFSEFYDFTDWQKIIGQNILVFSNSPQFESSRIASLSDKENHVIHVREQTFTVAITPIFNEERERLGTIFEWQDRTKETQIEQEIDKVIEAASQGDFSASLDLVGKTGFFNSVSKGLNTLLETTNIAIQDVARVLSALANGDLDQTIKRDYQGQFGQLKTDVNDTVAKLQDVIGEITSSSASIARGSAEISEGTRSLGQRTEQQAATLEQTAASMEEITTMVENSESHANEVTALTDSAVEISRKGNHSIEMTGTAMQEISKASNEIANIITVIDEIAFQTNLLALNAAVEAARAGEQGRGFAVVAAEVRNLAQRSASAAKDIKGLILDSVDKVDEGIKQVNESDKTLKSIVSEIEQVNLKMQELLTGAKEQAAGIQQINTAISQLDGVTQENSALVEEAMAASETMASQSTSMDSMIAFFRK